MLPRQQHLILANCFGCTKLWACTLDAIIIILLKRALQASKHGIRLVKMIFWLFRWIERNKSELWRCRVSQLITSNECIQASRLCVWCLIYSFICFIWLICFPFVFATLFKWSCRKKKFEFTLQSEQLFYLKERKIFENCWKCAICYFVAFLYLFYVCWIVSLASK